MGACKNILVAVFGIVLAYFGSNIAYWFLVDGPRCPLPADIQTDYVRKHFDVRKLQGVWYELAYHDITQPISVCGCERSVKHYRPESNHIFDNFTLWCSETQQYANLTFNLNGHSKGHMHGHWPWLPMIVWPNTIVALGVDKVTDKYNWVIEFQCVEYFNRVAFTGINFYHKQRFVEDGELEGMMEIARQQGLGHWMDSGLKVHVVNHTGCTYPPVEQNLLELFEQY